MQLMRNLLDFIEYNVRVGSIRGNIFPAIDKVGRNFINELYYSPVSINIYRNICIDYNNRLCMLLILNYESKRKLVCMSYETSRLNWKILYAYTETDSNKVAFSEIINKFSAYKVSSRLV